MPDGPPVTPGSTSLGDYLAGLYGAVGVLIALLHVRAGGSGQVVDIGLYEAVFRVLDELAPAYARAGIVREREGAGTRNSCPHGHFPTGDGKWIAIACTTDKMFARLARAMERGMMSGLQLLIDPRHRKTTTGAWHISRSARMKDMRMMRSR